jgi:hypothetical protein
MRYAAETNVSCERSKAEIETTLRKYGADQFMSGWKDGQAAVQFRLKSKMVRFVLPLPDRQADEFCLTGCRDLGAGHGKDKTGYHSSSCYKARPVEQAESLWEQACRQRWRALSLAIKAKLEAVECGITTFEEEFLAHIVIPGQGGKTMGQLMIARIDEAYQTGQAPQLGWEG